MPFATTRWQAALHCLPSTPSKPLAYLSFPPHPSRLQTIANQAHTRATRQLKRQHAFHLTKVSAQTTSLPARHQRQRKSKLQHTQNHSADATAPQHPSNRNASAKNKRHPQQFRAPPEHAIVVATRAQLQTVVQKQTHCLKQHASHAHLPTSTPFPGIRHPTNTAT